jgi:mRNA interferase MazF
VNGRRGEIWYVRPEPTVIGAEMQKDRLCLVVQPPEMDWLRTTIVAPMTGRGFEAPFRLRTTFGRSKYILLDHLRAIDRARLRRRAGELDADELANVLSVLQAMFAF